MSDTNKLRLTWGVTILSALVAAVAGLYPIEDIPEWARVSTTIGGAVIVALGALGIKSQLKAKS